MSTCWNSAGSGEPSGYGDIGRRLANVSSATAMTPGQRRYPAHQETPAPVIPNSLLDNITVTSCCIASRFCSSSIGIVFKGKIMIRTQYANDEKHILTARGGI